MIEFFNNAWIIGIGGGVISGFIVFIITGKIFSKRENKEYLQKIRMANNELLYAVRPLIVELRLPTWEIFQSILVSTAKKYNLKTDHLYNRTDIADDLIKEIMDNPFLTSESKLNYCKLANEIKDLRLTQFDKMHDRNNYIYIEKAKSISTEYLSLLLGVITALMALAASLLAFANKGWAEIVKANNGSKDLKWIGILTIFTLIPVIAIGVTRYFPMLKGRPNKEWRSEKGKDENDHELDEEG